MLSRIYPILEREKVIYCVFANTDITNQKESEKYLQKREAEFNAIFNSITDAIIFSDVQRHIIMINPAFTTMFGYSLEEVKDRTTELLYFNKSTYDTQREKFRLGDLTGQNIFEVTYKHKNGTPVSAETLGIPVKDADGKIIGYAGIHRDITSRKKVEKALLDSEHELRTIFSAITDVIFTLDDNGTYLKVAPTNPRLLYRPSQELLGKRLHEIYSREQADFFLSSIHNTLTLKKTTSIEYKIQIEEKDIIFEVRISPLSEHSVIWIARDITEQKKAESEHLQLKNLESLGILAGGIAHDFNNLLTTIMGQASITLLKSKDENIKKNISNILEATKDATNLTQQLLNFAKGGTLHTNIISIRKIIEDITKISLEGSNIEVRFNFQDSIHIEADPGQLAQAIQNIIINAKESMISAGKIDISTRDVLEDKKPFLKISVKDTGIGISKENINKIFDPYFTTKIRASEKGSGLGLSVSYTIIKRHNGKILVNSQVGFGTTFEIFLPASEK
jgi:PAS domain S-box-containing protein